MFLDVCRLSVRPYISVCKVFKFLFCSLEPLDSNLSNDQPLDQFQINFACNSRGVRTMQISNFSKRSIFHISISFFRTIGAISSNQVFLIDNQFNFLKGKLELMRGMIHVIVVMFVYCYQTLLR